MTSLKLFFKTNNWDQLNGEVHFGPKHEHTGHGIGATCRLKSANIIHLFGNIEEETNKNDPS